MPSRRVSSPRTAKSSPGTKLPRRDPAARNQPWTFLTNHSHVLVCLLQEPSLRLRDVASRIGITERAVQNIVLDLERAKILRRVREGRRNRYSMSLDSPLRHPVEAHCTVRELLWPILSKRPTNA